MSKIKSLTVIVLTIVAVAGMAGMPVMAQSSSGNIICEDASTTTSLGAILQPVITIIVTLAALIAIVGGAGYTMASAARPEESDYVENRNKSILYGGGAIIVLYGANALIGQIAPSGTSLEFGCVLPAA